MALALRAHAILLVFEKFTRAYLFQICTRNRVITYTKTHGISLMILLRWYNGPFCIGQ